MERSPSYNLDTDEEKNGSIFKRVYNSLHRPKKGVDPMMDAMDKLEQERLREQRKKDVPHRPEGRHKHNTISGIEQLVDPPLRASSMVEDSSNSHEFGEKKIVTRLRSNSATAHTTPPSSIPIPSTPARNSDSSSTHLRSFTLSSTNGKKSGQGTDPQISTEENSTQPKNRSKTKSVPAKPTAQAYKEFRPEKKEKISLDALRLSYEAAAGTDVKSDLQDKPKSKKDTTVQAEKRSQSPATIIAIPANTILNVEKPVLSSSRLPSTLLPVLYILNEERSNLKINHKSTTKPTTNNGTQRPKHPYIPKRMDSSSSLFSMPLRASSSAKHSPRKQTPPPTSTESTLKPSGSTRMKSGSMIKPNKERPIKMTDSFESNQPILVTPTELSRSQTEVISNHTTNLRRQRSHHISSSPTNGLLPPAISPRSRPSSPPTTTPPTSAPPKATSPVTTSPATNSPNSETASSNFSKTASSGFEGFSLRRKIKSKNIRQDTVVASKQSQRSKSTDKKMQTQVITAKDIAAYDGKLPADKIFQLTPATDPPTKGLKHTQSTASITTPSSLFPSPTPSPRSATTSVSSPSSPTSSPPPSAPIHKRTLSSTSSPASMPKPIPQSVAASLKLSNTDPSSTSSPFPKVPPTNPKNNTLKVPYSYPKPPEDKLNSSNNPFEPLSFAASPKPATLKVTPNPNPEEGITPKRTISPPTAAKPRTEKTSPVVVPRLVTPQQSGPMYSNSSNPASPRSGNEYTSSSSSSSSSSTSSLSDSTTSSDSSDED